MGFVPRGIIPPIITPLTDDGEVNYTVLRQMVNHLIDNGVHGLLPLGTTGEFYAFDDDTYRKILETVKDETRGRVPVYGGANHITTRGVIRLTRDNDNFRVLMGRDTLIHVALCYGATGAIASCANVAPRIAADIYDKYIEAMV